MRLTLLLRRLAASLRLRRMDGDLRDEIAGHLAEATDEFVRRGLPPGEARLAALRSFGGVTQTEEVHRDVRSLAWLNDLRQDLRQTGRSFAKTPAFTAVAILTLALGIGANTTIVTLLDAVVFKPLPVPAPHELIAFYENGPEGAPDPLGGTGRFLRFSYGRFERLQRALGSRGSLAAVTRSSRLILRLPGEAERRFIQAQFVSGGYFRTLGVQAGRGRLLAPDDVRTDRASAVAVVSDGLWRRSLGGSDAALGQTIAINGVGVTVRVSCSAGGVRIACATGVCDFGVGRGIARGVRHSDLSSAVSRRRGIASWSVARESRTPKRPVEVNRRATAVGIPATHITDTDKGTRRVGGRDD